MSKFSRSPFQLSAENGRVVCRVTFDAKWQEYRARLTVDGCTNEAADYFTDDADDATDTAAAMVKQAREKLQPLPVQDDTLFRLQQAQQAA